MLAGAGIRSPSPQGLTILPSASQAASLVHRHSQVSTQLDGKPRSVCWNLPDTATFV